MHFLIRFLPAALLLYAFGTSALAQVPQAIRSLKNVAVPAPPNLSTYVRDPVALTALGKALFWDLQVGSDGKVACATCHFHAGADHRIHNQLSNSLGSFEPNYKLTAADFPFHQLADPSNNASKVVRDSAQVAGSAGMFTRHFTGIVPGLPLDDGADTMDSTFHVGNSNLRQVGGRNAPSAINAVFNFRNFWDGRAGNIFSGLTPFGVADTRANILSNSSGALKLESLRIENSSLASQAVGPVLNGAEMSYDSRSWPKVGKKLLALRPLAYQRIAADDSVLGSLANSAGRGLKGDSTYFDLVKGAFQAAYWNSAQLTDESGTVLNDPSSRPAESQFSQAEINFAMFFGLAVQAYESTLVSDDTRIDRFAEGQVTALSNTELAGMRLFTGPTGCTACHSGAELTLATYSGVNGNDPLKSGAETGFFHIGARPIGDDAGLGALDGFGNPLSATFPAAANSPASAQGRFKTPGLRNIEFTGPYFHDGGQATLEQVVQFYNRGGDFPVNPSSGPNVRRLALSAADQASMIAFLKALSDDRVRFERAPFDHPELCVPDGHLQAAGSALLQADGNPAFALSAADRWAGLPPVGRNGSTVPLQTFEELLAGVGADGSRAHSLSDACGIDALTATGFINANAAALKAGVLAQNSIISAFGRNFAGTAASATTNPPPTTLAGSTLSVQDSAGVSRNAPLFYASPAQINYVIPEGTALGSAIVSIAGSSTVFRAPVQITRVSPGLFGTGGLAAANVIVSRDGVQNATNVLKADAAGNVSLVPIDLGPADQQVVLILYGTGIGNHVNPVTATIGAVTVTATYAGAQGTFPGEDQINILLPQTLRGAGIVDVTLTVDGQTTNPVKIQIQ
ncbi:MAG: hypothetical protein M3Z36_05530 [Acidobacteriota bacterium]|nr:hypothetical protein [Acidobacteriota bacterium]